MIDINTLRFCPLFKGIPPFEITILLEKVNYQILEYTTDVMIAQHGDECNRLMIVLEGWVRGEMMDKSGKTIKIEDMGPGHPLASAFVFGMQNRFPVNIIANESVKIMVVYVADFISLMQMDARVLHNYLNVVCTRSQFLANKIKFLSFMTIKEKIAHYLIEKSQGNTFRIIELNQSQQELADLFGVTRPSLARAIGEMEADGIITMSKKQIIIEDFSALQKSIQ